MFLTDNTGLSFIFFGDLFMANDTIRKKLLIISLHADPSMPPGVGEWGGTHTYMRELLTDVSVGLN